MLLLLEGRFEGSSLKLKHPSRQRILLCWSPFAQEPQKLFVVFFWSHRAMFIGWSACFQIFAASLSFISALARTDFDFDTVTPASVFDNGFSNQCDMISFISFAAYRSDLVYQDLTSSFFSLENPYEGTLCGIMYFVSCSTLTFSLSSEGLSWDIFNTLSRTLSSCLPRSWQSSKGMDCECRPMWMEIEIDINKIYWSDDCQRFGRSFGRFFTSYFICRVLKWKYCVREGVFHPYPRTKTFNDV